MSLNIFWFLPTHGDGHYLGTSEGARAVDYGYLQQVAQAADRLGFGGVLIPTGRSCEDSWLVAAALIPVTQRLKFLVALRPGIVSPTVAARQAATLDRLSGGRALFNLVTGGDPEELAGDGLFLSHEERYQASVEFTRKNCPGTGQGCQTRTYRTFRHSPARHRARNQRRGLESGRQTYFSSG